MYTVAALYKFVSLDDHQSFQTALKEQCVSHNIIGTLLLAQEGINGTIAGSDADIEAILKYLRSDPRLADLEVKLSYASSQPFYRLKVRVKKEIVTMGIEDVDPNKVVGTYIEPQSWNSLISDPDVVLIDTRNDYESCVGSFKGAVHPNTRNFRDFPEWLSKQAHINKKTKVAMFCTGGIRCEKATSYMKEQGYEEVYHLKGGILKYLEEVPKQQSLWEGSCFVFDQRVGVEHALEESELSLCYACGFPVTEKDMEHVHFEQGVSCPQCFGRYTPEQIAGFRERQKQITLAASRNEQHIGVARRHSKENP